jgi:hypothetical protein
MQARTMSINDVLNQLRAATGHYYSGSTITNWIKKGRLKAKKFGTFWMVDAASLQNLIRELDPDYELPAAAFAKFDFGFTPRPMLRLTAVEATISARGLNPPSRSQLINLVKSNVLDGKKISVGYIVAEDSLLKWIDSKTAVS